ncbi:uncharacterized protein LOC144650085 [Oculina patagonica]
MSGPPPHGYYPASGQHPSPLPGQGYLQASVPPPSYDPSGHGGHYSSHAPQYHYPGEPSPAQAAYPPGYGPPPGTGFYAGPAGAYPPPVGVPPGQPPPQGGPYPGAFHPAVGSQPGPPFLSYSGPHPEHFPSHSGPYPGQKHEDAESDDSDLSEYNLYSREDKHPLTVKFTNRTGKKIQLFWINKKGRRKRKGKLKDGQSKTLDTYQTHVFMAFNKKLSREPLLINGSPVFYAFPHKHDAHHLDVEIKKPSGNSLDKLKSDAHVTVPVEVKFVNRTRHAVQLVWITPQGRREKKKVLAKGRCWRTTSWEGHYWVCCDPKHDEHLFALNYGLHYRVQKTRGAKERIVITADMNISGSSNSSSSSD